MFDTQLGKLGKQEIPARLNLTHVTTHATMLDICRMQSMATPNDCPVYHEKLIYTFYGRPAYRMRDNETSPTCLLFDSEIISNAVRMLPFDSGGFSYYGPVMDAGWSKEDFELQISLGRIQELLACFWGDDTAYYDSKVTGELEFSPSYDKLNQYSRLISNKLPVSFDTRCSSPEAQLPSPLDVSVHLDAIVVPDSAIDDELKSLAIKLEAHLIPYRFDIPFKQTDFFKPIHYAVRDYYDELGLL